MEGVVTPLTDVKVEKGNLYYPDLDSISFTCRVHGGQSFAGDEASITQEDLTMSTVESVGWTIRLAGLLLWKSFMDKLGLS